MGKRPRYWIRRACRTVGGKETDPAAVPDVIPWAGGMEIEIAIV